MPSIEEQLKLMSENPTDTLKHISIPASFVKLPWSTGSGTWSEANGWKPPAFSEGFLANSPGGIAYATNIGTSGAQGAAVLCRLSSQAVAVGRSFSVWLFAQNTVKANGYQVEAVYKEEKTGFHYYEIKCWRWLESVGTLLGTFSEFQPLEDGSGLIAASYVSGKLTFWNRFNTGSSFSKGGTFTDATFGSGWSGLAGSGSNPNFINFATGEIFEGKEYPHKKQPHRGLIMSGRRSI
jgi:hypothetical protein